MFAYLGGLLAHGGFWSGPLRKQPQIKKNKQDLKIHNYTPVRCKNPPLGGCRGLAGKGGGFTTTWPGGKFGPKNLISGQKHQ